MSADSSQWRTRAFDRKTEEYAGKPEWEKAMNEIQASNGSIALKHVAAEYAASLMADQKKLPERILSKKRTESFKQSAAKTVADDRGTFQISGMITMICAVLIALFVRAVMMDKFLINFSVDALVAAAAAGFLFVNLRTQFDIIRLYSKITDFVWMDILGVALWFCLMLWLKQFDASLFIFIVVYLVERWRFDKSTQAFLKQIQNPDQK